MPKYVTLNGDFMLVQSGYVVCLYAVTCVINSQYWSNISVAFIIKNPINLSEMLRVHNQIQICSEASEKNRIQGLPNFLDTHNYPTKARTRKAMDFKYGHYIHRSIGTKDH